MEEMKAIGFYAGHPIEHADSFIEQKLPIPVPTGHDLLVKISGISVNPVDTKLRSTAKKEESFKILGYDAVGTVVAIGSEVQDFQIGDRVFYAGTTKRAGSNQEFQLVTEEIVALAPKNWTDAEAVSIPLTGLTAFELLFEKFGLLPQAQANEGDILIINGAGGVGSILSQLASWAGLTVYSTSSPAKFSWLRQMGSAHELDHHVPLQDSLRDLPRQSFDYIAVLYDVTQYFEQLTALIKPFGHIGTIVGIQESLPLGALKNLSVSFDWEYMFAKTDHDYRIASQGAILQQLAQLAEANKLKPTVTKTYQGITVEHLKQATRDVEAGHMQGKVVLVGDFR